MFMKRSALIIIIATAISLYSVAGIKVTSGVKSDGTSYCTTSYIRCNGPLDDKIDQFKISLSRYISDNLCDTLFSLAIQHNCSYCMPVTAGDTMRMTTKDSKQLPILLECDSITPSGKTLTGGSSGGLTQPGTVIIPIPTKLAQQYVWHYSLTPAQLREIISSDITNIQPASNKNSPGIKIGKNRMVKAILKALEKIDSRQSLP